MRDAPSDLPRWQAEIERVIPRAEHTSWLYLRYEPGDPWHPIDRLFLWQVWPLAQTPEAALSALKGPHPRSTGHYCGGPGWCPSATGQDGKAITVCPTPKFRWVQGPKADWRISRQQYEVFREIGRYADPWWVIQGDRGGHRKLLFDWEKEALELATGNRHHDVPIAGMLPYAPCDRRVIDWITEYDVLRQWEDAQMLDFTKRTGLDVERYEAERRAKIGPLWGRWLQAQVDEMYEAAPGAWRELAGTYRAGGSDERARRKAEDRTYEHRLATLVAGSES